MHINTAGTLARLVYENPRFKNPQLHIYQHENVHCFRLIALPIKRNHSVFGYLLVGHYQF